VLGRPGEGTIGERKVVAEGADAALDAALLGAPLLDALEQAATITARARAPIAAGVVDRFPAERFMRSGLKPVAIPLPPLRRTRRDLRQATPA
jgi:hypothetical protein